MSARMGGRRKVLVGIVTVGLTLGASAAYAFWTGDDSTSGLASTSATTSGSIEIRQMNQLTGLVPDGQPHPIQLMITNTHTALSVTVASVHVTLPPFSVASGVSGAPPCTEQDFEVSDSNYGGSLSPGGSVTVYGSIKMEKKDPTTSDPVTDPSNQDACKGIDLDLLFTPVY